MMRRSRPGFISTPAILAGVLTALILTGFLLVMGGQLFNPGALNARSGPRLREVSSHAEFGNQCSLCHAPFWSGTSMAERCVICHTDVGVQLLVPSPLHGTLAQEAPGLTCWNCHSEHHGAQAALTNREVVPFPHAVLGYTLDSHQAKTDGSPFVCEDCHGQDDTKFDQAVCNTCHMQIDAAFMRTHSQVFGNNCLDCHSGKDSYGRNFDHSRVPYRLTGRHVQVACGGCHMQAFSLAAL